VPKLKIFFQQSWLLIVSSFFFGLLVAGANAAWKDKIDYNVNVYKFNKIAKDVLPEAANFEEVTQKIEIDTGSSGKVNASLRKALDSSGAELGWLFICQGRGYNGTIQLILAVDSKFEKIKGYGVLAQTETPTLGDRIQSPYYHDQFINAPAGEFVLSKTGNPEKIDSEIVAISGATISSKAVVDILNRFLPQVKKEMKEKELLNDGR
jgi:electron transport complex protein RnfG